MATSKIPPSYKNDDQADSRYNPAELRAAEQAAAKQDQYARDADRAKRDTRSSSEGSQETTDNIDNARDREQAGSGFKVNMDNIRNVSKKLNAAAGGKISTRFNFKKAGPTGAVIGAALAGFGILTFTPAGIPLLSFSQNATDARANSSRVQAVRHESSLRYMIGNKDVEAACAKSVSSIRCKLGTMSEKTKAQYESSTNKFKIDGEKVGNRWIVRSITAPDGTVMKTGDSFLTKMKTDVKFRLSAIRAYNVRSLVFNGGEYLKRVLIPKGLDKSLLPKLPSEKEAQIKELNKLFKLNEDGKVDEGKLKSNIEERTKNSFDAPDGEPPAENEGGRTSTGKIKLAKGLAAIPGAACVAYNTARLVVNTAKIERTLYLASLTMPFLKAGSQIRDNGSIDETTVSALSNQITATAPSGDEKGLSALDSQGIKLLFGSDEEGLASYTKNFMLYNNTILKDLDGITGRVDAAAASVPGGGGSVRTMCRIVNSWQGQLIGVGACVALAAVQGGGGAAAGSVVPLVGNIVGGAAGLVAGGAECIAAVGASFVIGRGIAWILENYIVPWSMKAAVEGLPNATTVGPKLGEGLAVGVGAILNGGNRINGLLPEKASSLSAFNASLSESDALYKEAEVLAAKDTPFDVYNRYSFLGSIVSNMNNLVYTQDARMASGNLSIQRLLSAFSLTPSALAIAESPSVISASDMTECKDYTLKLMGASCDISDIVPYGMTKKALLMDIKPNLQWMESHDQITETGDAKADGTPVRIDGRDYTYAKAVQYCFERQTEIGTTTEPIESDDYEWATGERCYDENEAMDNYQAYHSSRTANNDGDQTEGQGVGGGIGLSVMSYNLLGSGHSNDGGQSVSTRLNNFLITMKAEQPDVAGFQEVSGFRDDVHDMLSDTYDGWPIDGDGEKDAASRPIYWNKTKFTATDKGSVVTNRYGNSNARFPYVKLEDSSGKSFYIFNIHTSANGYNTPGYTPAEARAMQTRDMIKVIKEKAGYNAATNSYATPVVTTGDYNSVCEKTDRDTSVSTDEIPCALLNSAGLADAGITAYEASQSGLSVAAISTTPGQTSGPVTVENYEYNTSHGTAGSKRDKKSSGIGRHIDHVFYSSQFRIAGWKNVITPATESTSDHTPVIARLAGVTGGSEDEVTGGPGWEMPIKNAQVGMKWHAIFNGRLHKGQDFPAANGTPIYAAHDGVVTSRRDAGACGVITVIKVSGQENLYMGYQHANTTVREGETVAKGQKIGAVGGAGPPCSFGSHLHFSIETANRVSEYADTGSSDTSKDPWKYLPSA